MRKVILLGAIAALGSLSFGCAMTDYPVPSETTNKSHGVIACADAQRFGNTQQTIEPATRDMLYTVQDPVTGNTVCPGFSPAVTTDFVSREDARDWNRWIGTYAFQAEAQVFGVGGGTFIACGMKEMGDGSVRLTTYGAPGVTGSFSCVGNSTNGRYGGPEGLLAGDGVGPGALIPGLAIDNVVIESSPAISFCSNIKAVSQFRAGEGFSLYAGTTGRGGEGKLNFTPITRRGNFAAMLTGQEPIDGSYQGVDFTLWANLREDGRMSLEVAQLTHDGVTYEAASEPRLSIVINPEQGLRTMEVHAENTAEVRSLAAFLLNSGLADRELDLSEPIVDLGMSFPVDHVMIVGDYLRGLLEDSGEGTAGF